MFAYVWNHYLGIDKYCKVDVLQQQLPATPKTKPEITRCQERIMVFDPQQHLDVTQNNWHRFSSRRTFRIHLSRLYCVCVSVALFPYSISTLILIHNWNEFEESKKVKSCVCECVRAWYVHSVEKQTRARTKSENWLFHANMVMLIVLLAMMIAAVCYMLVHVEIGVQRRPSSRRMEKWIAQKCCVACNANMHVASLCMRYWASLAKYFKRLLLFYPLLILPTV